MMQSSASRRLAIRIREAKEDPIGTVFQKRNPLVGKQLERKAGRTLSAPVILQEKGTLPAGSIKGPVTIRANKAAPAAVTAPLAPPFVQVVGVILPTGPNDAGEEAVGTYEMGNLGTVGKSVNLLFVEAKLFELESPLSGNHPCSEMVEHVMEGG
jgi:hypothetical protein